MSVATATRESTETQLVAFHLANEIYGIEISAIHEIILMPEITHIPRAARDVQGVINLRGKIVPVLNLRSHLGLSSAASTRNTRIIVVQKAEMTVGLIVDDVVGVMRIPDTQIEPPSNLITELDTDFIRGVGKQGEQLIILLEMTQVLRHAA